MPAKGGGKKIVVEDEPEEEAPQQIIPPSPFNRYEEIWMHSSLEKQRLAVGEIFSLPNGPSHSLQAMDLDDAFGHLLFTKELNLNLEQAKKFYEIMMGIKENLSSQIIDVTAAFTTFKETLMSNCTLKAPPPQREELKKPVDDEEPLRSASRNSKKGDKSAKAAPPPKAGAKGRALTPDDAEPVEKPVEKKKPLLDHRFSCEHITAMTEYAATGVFGHYLLHKAVFDTTSFKPRKYLHAAVANLNLVIPDGFKLEDAIDQDDEDYLLAEEKRKEEEEAELQRIKQMVDVGVDVDPDSAVGKLIEQYMRGARNQMKEQLVENEKNLESKFDEFAIKFKAK